MGTYALLYSQNQVKAIGPLSAHAVRILWLAAAWTAIQFMIGIVGLGGIGRIAIGAHIGGFVAGLLLTRPLIHLRFRQRRSEEHTSELQSLMRISYAVFCLKKTKITHSTTRKLQTTEVYT